MLRFCTFLVICALFLALFALPTTAMPYNRTQVIQNLLDDAVRISGTPGVSAAIIYNNQTYMFSAGHTSIRNRSVETEVDEYTLFVIGSLSKAFTGSAILLLQERGMLCLSDRIDAHLPWFYLLYQNQPAEVTILHLLNHTSGLSWRHSDAPRIAEGLNAKRYTIEPFIGASLDYVPGTVFSYANANFNILGLIIEYVTGQTFDTFMREQFFSPLGMTNTFVYQADAIATGRMAQGHRHGFFLTFPFDTPIYGGMIPTGFIISNIVDMSRWMSIQLGLVYDIPEEFVRVVKNSHETNVLGASMGEYQFYSAGWVIDTQARVVTHAGQTPSFLANVVIKIHEQQGAIFLSNGTSMNFGLARDMLSIIGGDTSVTYTRGENQRIDIRNSLFIIAMIISMIYCIIFGIRCRIKEKPVITKSKMIWVSVSGLVALFGLFRIITYPRTVGSGWHYIFDWNPPSLTISVLLFPLVFIAMAWYTYVQNPKKPVELVGEDNNTQEDIENG